jgi:predicted ATPase with chaperone activity
MAISPSPQPPNSLEAAGLTQALVEDLVLKHLLALGEFKLADVAQRVRLPISLVELVLEEHRRENRIEVKGSANYAKTSYLFRLTELGRRKGQELQEHCRYTGPVPVCLEDYREMVQKQTLRGAAGGEEPLRKALSHLVLDKAVLQRLGPAMTSGQALFIYGPSGNGKTSIAEAVGRALPDNIYVPYAVTIGGEIISVFDPVCHTVVETSGDSRECDSRWVLIKRPVVNAGGELTLKMLDLNYSHASGYYEASLQMKANNGLFILDDFGRQQSDPARILNRWVVPLDRHIDHMTLENGMRFAIPFDVLVIFSTDLDPKNLVQEAFLRRMRYKIRIERPTEEEYLEIFKKVCQSAGMEFCQEAYSYLDEWYGANSLVRSACHPRDLIDHIVNHSRFYGKSPQLTRESLSAACADYFVPM